MSNNANGRQTETKSLEEKLYTAIYKSDIASVKYLLDRGADVSAYCPAGRTAFGTAALYGRTDIIKIFLDYEEKSIRSSSAKSNYLAEDRRSAHDSSLVDDSPTTSLQEGNRGFFIMVHKDDEEAPENEEGRPDRDKEPECDVNLNEAVTPDDMEKLEWDFEEIGSEDERDDPWKVMYNFFDCSSPHTNYRQQRLVDQKDLDGRTALHYAAQEGHVETIRVLLKAGASVMVRDFRDMTPLYLAAAHNYPAIVSMLLSAGQWRNMPDMISALHIAAARGHTTLLLLLLDANVDINAQDENGRTPIMLAAYGRQYAAVLVLVRRGAKVNIEDHDGKTPLNAAVMASDVQMTELLLRAGARLTQSDLLLHRAVIFRQTELARLLLSAGAMVNLRDDYGDTPLIIAAKAGHVEMAEILIQAGGNPNYANSVSGVTPLHEVVGNIRECLFDDFRNFVQILRQAGARLDVESSTLGDTPLIAAMILEKTKFAAHLVKLGANVNQAPLHPCHIDILTLLRRSGNLQLVQLFVAAGLKLKNRLEGAEHKGVESPVEAWLRWAASNPMALANQCRIVIRNKYKDKISEVVESSHLPKPVKKFLMFDDISFDVQ